MNSKQEDVIMKFKKLIALVAVSIMTISTLSACGNTASNSTSASGSGKTEEQSGSNDTASTDTTVAVEDTGIVFPLEEAMTFTGFAGMNNDYKLSETLAWQTALEMGNLNIELTEVLGSELSEKTSLILSSGKYPDIFIKTSVDGDEYGMEGIFIPLEDLIKEYMPNLTAFLDEIDAWQYITAADGHIYTLPMGQEKKPRTSPFWLNRKWMDNLGLDMPTSYEELYNVLKAFKEEDANGNGDPDDEIPFVSSTSRDMYCLLDYQNYKFDNASYMG